MPRQPKDSAPGAALGACSRVHRRSSTASRRRTITRRPSSARTSSACSATAPRNIWSTPISGETTCIPKTSPRVEAEQAKLFEKGRHTAEYRFRKSKWQIYLGQRRTISAARRRRRARLEIVGSWSNITARKDAEQAENAARARFDLLLHGAPAVVYSFKAPATTRRPSSARTSSACWATSLTEYLKKPGLLASRVHPEDLARGRGRAGQLFEEGRNVAEYRFRKQDGIYCWVSDEQHLVERPATATRSK